MFYGQGAGGDPTASAVLGDLAALMREHLPADDPVLPFADVLDDPVLGGQTLRGYLTGSVDIVLRIGERHLVVDYKTNRPAPDAVEAVDPAYVLQAAVYVAVLRAVFPGRRVEAAEIAGEGAEGLEDRVVIVDIEWADDNAALGMVAHQFVAQRLETFGTTGAEREIASLGGEFARHASAEAGGCASDENGFAHGVS